MNVYIINLYILKGLQLRLCFYLFNNKKYK